MFHHIHPYPPFIPDHATKLIVGTLPPPRFSTGELKEGDVDFCYGSRDGQLWQIIDKVFDLHLKFENTEEAIDQRKQFLIDRGIGICDMVASGKRKKIDASDLGLEHVRLRNLLKILHQNPEIKLILFTGGNSRNGPEYFFRQHLRAHDIKFELISDVVPRIHSFKLSKRGRIVKTVTLTAPSGSANRAVGAMPLFKELKKKNPEFSAIDFRVMQYKEWL